jgi:transcription-repair coupling factor (superfamily II helicase)
MKNALRSPAEQLVPGRSLTLANVADGAEGLIVSDLARAVAARPKPPAISLAVICRDGPRMSQLARALEFFAPDIDVMQFPAWDCQPYDRVSPHNGIVAQRVTTLARLSRLAGSDKPLIVLTTVNAVVQRVPAREQIAAQALSVAPGNVVPMDSIVAWLEHNGYNRSSTVRESGEYAVRGGILDLYPAGLDQPVRLDFFGDALESIRSFDAESQRTLAFGIERADRLQRVAEEIEADRLVEPSRIKIENAAAHGVFAGFAHGGGTVVAVVLEPSDDGVHRHHVARRHRQRLRRDLLACRHPLHNSVHRGEHDQRLIAAGQP